MKLRVQIIALGLAGALAAGITGAIGLLTTAKLGDAINDAIDGGNALQASQEADMMHDAIRGDGQLAMLGAIQKDSKRIDEAEKGLAEHGAKFEQNLDKLAKAPLTPEGQEALKIVRPIVKRYIETAQTAVKDARQSAEQAQKSSDELQVVFTDLEGKMAKLSDAIEHQGDELTNESRSRLSQARLAIGVSLLVLTAAMVLLATWVAARMTAPMDHAVEVADRLALGELGGAIVPAGNDETQRLLQSMARMQASFVGIVRDVKGNADQMAMASAQIAQGNLDLSARTEEQASALEETSATMEQLGATVTNNAQSAAQARQLAQGATEVATRGGAVMSEVVRTMSGINESSRRIADIISAIDGIAFQTNILALNAAVEAARAGEQGRGFAVVASEVRSLAQRSATAAREIKGLVATSIERVEQGTDLVGRAGTTMEEIVGSIRRVNDIVSEISAASAQQATGVGAVSEAVAQMDRSTQQNAALVEQSAAAADSLKQQAARLVQAVAAFKLAGGPD